MEINLFDITRISAKWLQSCDLLPLRLMKMKSRMSRKKSHRSKDHHNEPKINKTVVYESYLLYFGLPFVV